MCCGLGLGGFELTRVGLAINKLTTANLRKDEIEFCF